MLIQFPKKIRTNSSTSQDNVAHAVSMQNQDGEIGTVFTALNRTACTVTLYTTRVAAGLPSPAEYFEEEALDLNEHLLDNPLHTFFVRVTGESMIGAGIHPGDLLIVDRSLRPNNGRIVIAVINGELTVKKLFKEKNQLFLMPENPMYPCIEIDESMDFMIWGVVTNVIHAL